MWLSGRWRSKVDTQNKEHRIADQDLRITNKGSCLLSAAHGQSEVAGCEL